MKTRTKIFIKKFFQSFGISIERHYSKRPFLIQLCKYFKEKEVTGVEIGTYKGKFSKKLLNYLNIKKLYLVDPYLNYEDYKNDEISQTTQDVDNAKRTMLWRLDGYEDKYIFIQKLSSEAADDIPDNLDFVYIDGNHSYNYVKEDIEKYFPKVRKGGIIGGHDFTPFCDVVDAVVDFVYEHKLQLIVNGKDWYVFKDKKKKKFKFKDYEGDNNPLYCD